MGTATRQNRIEMRVDDDTKKMAERASAAMGCASLTDFVTQLIREHAPRILEAQTTIQATNAQFDTFMAACQDNSLKPSSRILEAAKRLDGEGF